MQVSSLSTRPQLRSLPPFISHPTPPTPQDGFQASSRGLVDRLPNFAMGAAVGGIGIGVPGALTMGGVKALISGQIALGLGLTAAGLGVGSFTAPMSLMGAVMSTDAGDTSGWHGYLAGAAASLGGAAVAIF